MHGHGTVAAVAVLCQGVVPELLTNREAHQCQEFEGVFLVVGGYGPAYIYYLHSV